MMTMRPLTSRRPPGAGLALALLACHWLAGCAGPGGLLAPSGKAPAFRDPALSMQSAQQIVVPGKSTQADVLAALGRATVVRFDSGFEVWVYRDRPARSADSRASAEFVILFTPSGVAKKTRIRPAYDAPGG
ncbi:MAG: hypothetical protein JWR60_753 [Polaromonas sp.]|nr:hypothetical protein [Polaromonas sp.]